MSVISSLFPRTADQTVASEPTLLLLDDSSQDVDSFHPTDNEQPDVQASPEPLITRSSVVAEQESLGAEPVDEQVERRQTIDAGEDPSQWPSIQKLVKMIVNWTRTSQWPKLMA